ncbi:MAG: methylglyoxal synthase [Defluviitaleaceae bacterium]|nr:methylglyoxal synthase [Defluviitaleaceae bacterium]
MNIALIAHDKKKNNIIEFAKKYLHILKNHNLYATGTTGTKIEEATNLSITKFNSGPLGGDQQIGAKVSEGQMDLIVFFRDPLTPQPHEPDVNALLRLCDVYNVPIATNLKSATMIFDSITSQINA